MSTTYEFDLVLSGLDVEADVGSLDAFEERVKDMTFASHDGTARAAVERRSSSMGEAIRSAIVDVEAIPGVQVLRVEPEDYVSQAEIAKRVGRSRASISQWVAGVRGPGGFPPPVFESGRIAVWRWAAVCTWLGNSGLRGAGNAHSALVIGAANALLEARRAISALDEKERSPLAELVA
jgi:hypothetical protein